MNGWARRIRGAIGMGLLWALGGLLVGGMFELVDNVAPGALPFIRLVDMWPQTLAIPFFLGGVLFSIVLGIVARRRRFDELSLPQFAAWGAFAGLLLGGYAVSRGAPLIAIPLTLLGSTVAASSSLALAKRAERRALPGTSDDGSDVGLSDAEKRELLGRG